MLTNLRIRQFAIVDELDLDLGAGFTVVSGETGAGKSILVDALGLLAGNRADAAAVRPGAERADLQAEFDVSSSSAADWLREHELDADGECLVRRTISAAGGSRAYINANRVTIQQLRALADHLIDIHGQHEHQRLLTAGARLALLDQAGVEGQLLNACRGPAADWRRLRDELERLEAAETPDTETAELMQFQVDELEQHTIGAEQFAELEAEHTRLSHAESLLAGSREVLDALQADEDGMLARLQAGVRTIDGMREHAPELGEVAQMLEEARINLAESANTLNHFADHVELDPARLRQVEARLEKLHDLARKHRTQPAALPERLHELQQRLAAAGDRDQRLAAARAAVDQARADYDAAAAELSHRREQVAAELGERAQSLCRELGMPEAQVRISIDSDPQREPAPRGRDRAQIVFSANPGQPPQPLGKVASGGELSRIGLALMVATQPRERLPAMIFDEVDAGIGGATASTVGRLLAQLAADRQAFCVTHMAQVAACADHQLRIDKEQTDGATHARYTWLCGEDRHRELARMLSGKVTDNSLAHARELLAAGAAEPD